MVSSKHIVRKVATTTALAGMVFASPVVSEAALGDQTLSYGEKNKDVVELQDALKSKGFFNFHTSTGYYGDITTAAVKEFQDKHGLAVDGIFGPNTYDALMDVNEGQALRTLVMGDRGHQVKTLQEKLGGYYDFHDDGIFGPITLDAVKAFQRDKGLAVDGIVGKNTWAALNGKTVKTVSAPATTTNTQASTSETTSTSAPKHADAKQLTMEATAYTAYCAGCSGVTATGIDLRSNPNQKVVAVDPDVIPLGSKVYVEGYGTAIAGDTGGAIQGNRIDVFIPNKDDAMAFGRKTVNVTVLD
ncbi:peptidoglycan-binding protein [Bacillus marinisedimentorum]|uniref:peptidoglycan-binding protein n=1 Tax=Bacillus marinisedimentorum TaxID=1821260 RepID=UPI0007E13530|nr:peptidoglycan-binding protein [Bacillus marinisedimentorum]